MAPLVAGFALMAAPAVSNALNINWATNNTVGPNNVALTVRLVCSNSTLVCSGAGLSSPYQQTQTSQLTGTGTGSVSSAAGGSITFNDDFLGAGSNVNFTGIPTALQPGGVIGVSNIQVDLLNIVTAALTGYTDPMNGQVIPFTLAGSQWQATGATNNALLPTIAVGPIAISAPGTFVELGQVGPNLEFAIQNLRGAFDYLTATSISGATVSVTFRATFTLNLKGVALAIPEPGTALLLASGLVGFGVMAARRRASN